MHIRTIERKQNPFIKKYKALNAFGLPVSGSGDGFIYIDKCRYHISHKKLKNYYIAYKGYSICKIEVHSIGNGIDSPTIIYFKEDEFDELEDDLKIVWQMFRDVRAIKDHDSFMDKEAYDKWISLDRPPIEQFIEKYKGSFTLKKFGI